MSNTTNKFVFVFVLLFTSGVFAATGFSYDNPTTLRLYNDGAVKDFCINVTSGIALENCGFDWADTMWCAGQRRNANPWTYYCTDAYPFNGYRVDSDNLTYANVTFYSSLPGNSTFVLNYNLSARDAFISMQPNMTMPTSVPSNTTGRFRIIQRNININDTVENNLVYFTNQTVNLSEGGTTNLVNTSNESTFVIYRPDDGQQIFYGWNSPYKTSLDVYPQPGWGNRQLNLTFDVGLLQAKKSYSIPFKWMDLELACSPGTSVLGVSTLINATKANFTSIDRVEITASAFKMGTGTCVYYLYYKTTSAAKFSLVPSSMFTGNINLPIGYTIGNTSTVSTTQSSTLWVVQLGGLNTSWGNANYYKNFTFQVNVSGVTDDSGEAFGQGYKTIAIWDTRPPNMSITSNNSNWTNWTQGNIYIYGWANDETNARTIELYSNETGVWKLTDWLNASSNSINKTLFKNFTRTPATGCYLYGFRAMDTTFDVVSNKYNVTQNLTMCVNTTGAPLIKQFNYTNYSVQGFLVNFTGNVSDSSALSTCIFSFNITGSYVNESPIPISGTAGLCMMNKSFPFPGSYGIRLWVNNSANSFNMSQALILVTPSGPQLNDYAVPLGIVMAGGALAYWASRRSRR